MFDRATITLGIGPHSSSITCGFVVDVVSYLNKSTTNRTSGVRPFDLLRICCITSCTTKSTTNPQQIKAMLRYSQSQNSENRSH